jgi:hypothetical protein
MQRLNDVGAKILQRQFSTMAVCSGIEQAPVSNV